MPLRYQQEMAEISRAIWLEAECFVIIDRVKMAEKYAGKYMGWDIASEQCMTKARVVKDVELATETIEIQRKAQLPLHAEEKEISRVFEIKAKEVASQESRTAQAAAAQVHQFAEEKVLCDRLRVRDLALRSEEQT